MHGKSKKHYAQFLRSIFNARLFPVEMHSSAHPLNPHQLNHDSGVPNFKSSSGGQKPPLRKLR